MRILLIEDEKPLSAAICQILKKERFAVDAVYTGPDGLDYAQDPGHGQRPYRGLPYVRPGERL